MSPPPSPARWRGAGRHLAAVATTGALLACARAPEPAPAATAPPASADAGTPAADALRSLPYASSVPVVPDEAREGVVAYDAARAEPGLNLVAPRDVTRAFLLDMEGTPVHRWSFARTHHDGFHHVEPTPDGGLVALIKNRLIVRLDADSHVLWSRQMAVHHDVALLPDGGLWVPVRTRRWAEHDGERLPVLDDLLTRLDARGEVRRRIDLWGLFGGGVSARQWARLRAWRDAAPAGADPLARVAQDTPADLLHTNSVERLDRRVAGLGERGDLLISLRQLDTVAVVDPVAERVRWSWGPGELEHQHQPSVTPRDTLLLFDNGPSRGRSRVLEVDPVSGRTVWEFPAYAWQRLFSASRGGAQRLANGDTLITESDAGRALEVTPEGDVVWEMLAPLRPAVGDRPAHRAALYRVRRLPPGWPGARGAH